MTGLTLFAFLVAVAIAACFAATEMLSVPLVRRGFDVVAAGPADLTETSPARV